MADDVRPCVICGMAMTKTSTPQGDVWACIHAPGPQTATYNDAVMGDASGR